MFKSKGNEPDFETYCNKRYTGNWFDTNHTMYRYNSWFFGATCCASASAQYAKFFTRGLAPTQELIDINSQTY